MLTPRSATNVAVVGKVLLFLAAMTARGVGLLAQAPLAAASAHRYTQNVAIVLYDGVEILDFSGPAEVFQAASGFGASGQEKAFRVYTVARHHKPVLSQGFLHISPDYSIDDSPEPDILVLPGGADFEVVTSDAQWVEWVRTAGGKAQRVLTVCTGAFIAARAGLLDGHEATTFYRAVPFLAAQFPAVKVESGRRFVDSGKILSTAGVSAGIDGALHLVAKTLGRYVADRTAEYMEYRWFPESYNSAGYIQLNPRLDAHGRTLQEASIALHEWEPERAITMYRSLLDQDRGDAETWLALGQALHGQKRYREAIEAHLEAARGAAQRAAAFYNLSCEYALTGDREKALEAAENAVEAGFRAKAALLGDDDLASIRNDPRFVALVAKL